eukprot:1082739-Pyramimonas_sp.AAC.1
MDASAWRCCWAHPGPHVEPSWGSPISGALEVYVGSLDVWALAFEQPVLWSMTRRISHAAFAESARAAVLRCW